MSREEVGKGDLRSDSILVSISSRDSRISYKGRSEEIVKWCFPDVNRFVDAIGTLERGGPTKYILYINKGTDMRMNHIMTSYMDIPSNIPKKISDYPIVHATMNVCQILWDIVIHLTFSRCWTHTEVNHSQ